MVARVALAVACWLAAPSCASLSRARDTGLVTISIEGEAHEIQTFKPIRPRPATRHIFAGRELPDDGSGATTAMWLKPSTQDAVGFVWVEGTGRGTAVSVHAMPIGYPTDGVFRENETPDPGRATEPCVARSLFFIDGVGERPRAPVLFWQGTESRQSGMVIQPGTNVIRARPFLIIRASDVAVLRPPGPYWLHIAGSAARDYLVLALGYKDDRAVSDVLTLPPHLDRISAGPYSMEDRREWQFYAVADHRRLHSHCRTIR